MNARILVIAILAWMLGIPSIAGAEETGGRSETPVDTTVSDSSGLPVGPILLGGGGVVFLAVGGAIAIENDSNNDSYKKRPTSGGADDVQTSAIVSVTCLAVGGAMAVGALLWWLLDDGASHGEGTAATHAEIPHLAAAPLRDGGAVTLSLDF